MKSRYTYSDTFEREDLNDAVSFALAQLVQKLLAKPLFSNAAILTFLPPVTLALT